MTSQAKPTVRDADGDMVVDSRSPREVAWEKISTIPLILLSFVFLVGFSILILDDEVFTTGIDKYILGTLAAIWLVFIVDYVARLVFATDKAVFFRRNLIDLLSVVIPFFRPFLLLMYLSRLRYFRGRKGSSVRARLVAYATSFAIMYIYVLSLAVYAAERRAPGATIKSFGDALWWAMETISTVGYGDFIPVTVPGRVYASMLMMGGMVIVGLTTATVVSFLAERAQVAHRAALRQAEQAKKHKPSDDVDS
ncbi:MAG: two pore domain potassium channel family protein [Actinomycetales bacterium]|nr:two pore domain potassium channel family protein [Actinomycetales bacterium]